MKGNETQLLDFMEGKDKRYVIPVYQRHYDWKTENCRQLFDDLKDVVIEHRSSHFFGSIVSQLVPNGSRIEYQIIDGQQRLTTVSLLLLAISHLYDQKKVDSEEYELSGDIMESYIISKRAKPEDRIKLRTVKEDRNAYEKLVAGDPDEYDNSSNLTINYRDFCEQIMKMNVSVDDLYDAIKKLQIISITLEKDDDAQLIFESLNSTGLALTEGDKIRNYVLMGLSPAKQEEYYDKYWTKIENRTQGKVSAFVRDYLSIKQLITPTISNVYQSFKRYVETSELPMDVLLNDLKRYAGFYEKLITGDSGLNCKPLDACMDRLNRLEITVTEPFFMEVLRLESDGRLTVDDVKNVFLITENYLFRRNICDVPTNALSKIFLNLNHEIIRYDNSTDHYVDKMIYALLSKKESGRFPNDNEFREAMLNKQVYLMRGKYKVYLFERFENHDTKETKDVYQLLDDGTYTIEHIMPQNLTPAWAEALGDNAKEIHDTWLHRLGNLTLTAYNSNMSDSTFAEKRDAQYGYKNSGIRMNQRIAQLDSWGVKEISERNDEMVQEAVSTIWPMPVTDFKPVKKELDSCSLGDDVDLRGRDIVKYSYQNVETTVSSWSDMFEHVLKYLHSRDKSILASMAYTVNPTGLSCYFNNQPETLNVPGKIDEDIYVEKQTSTMQKISILKRLFILYKVEPMDLVFYLRDEKNDKATVGNRHSIRMKYWTYALPVIREANKERGTFKNVNPSTENWISGYFGISGFSVNCVANYNNARVEFYMSKPNAEDNKKAFDLLFQHKEEINKKLSDSEIHWDRADQSRFSRIFVLLNDVSITNENDWKRMADFQADWSNKLCNVILPYLKDFK